MPYCGYIALMTAPGLSAFPRLCSALTSAMLLGICFRPRSSPCRSRHREALYNSSKSPPTPQRPRGNTSSPQRLSVSIILLSSKPLRKYLSSPISSLLNSPTSKPPTPPTPHSCPQSHPSSRPTRTSIRSSEFPVLALVVASSRRRTSRFRGR